MKVVSPDFPGLEGLGPAFSIFDEWYVLHKFASDLHVILVQETKKMVGKEYRCPPYPATWARMHGKGRVSRLVMSSAPRGVCCRLGS